MEFPCWLCPSEFERKRFLKTHMENAPHCRLKVVCPWCTAFMVTANRTSDLKKHTVRAHPRALEGLPGDFFSEANGYYLALYPEDYKRVCLTGQPTSEAKATIIKLITKLNEVMPEPPKSMEEWRAQWNAILDVEQMSPRTKTSQRTTLSSSQNPTTETAIHYHTTQSPSHKQTTQTIQSPSHKQTTQTSTQNLTTQSPVHKQTTQTIQSPSHKQTTQTSTQNHTTQSPAHKQTTQTSTQNLTTQSPVHKQTTQTAQSPSHKQTTQTSTQNHTTQSPAHKQTTQTSTQNLTTLSPEHKQTHQTIQSPVHKQTTQTIQSHSHKQTTQTSTQNPTTQSPAHKETTQTSTQNHTTQSPTQKQTTQTSNQNHTQTTQNSTQPPLPAVSTSTRVASKPLLSLAEPSEELLGTRSWVNAFSSSHTQSKSKGVQETPSVTSTSPSVPVSHDPSTVLTPPRTPTSVMIPVGSSSTLGAASALNHSGNDLAQGEGFPATTTSGSAKTHTCGICGRQFPGPKNLLNHRKVHQAEMRYKCVQCGKRFFYPHSYNFHMRTAHRSGKMNKQTQYACPVCKCEFLSHEKLRIHTHRYNHYVVVNKKFQEEVFKCNKCPLTFTSQRSLKSHKQTHGYPQLPCPICKKVFPRISHLKCHVRQLHKTSLMDLARSGDRKAKLLVNVKQHIPRPYECELCGNRYETIQGKRKHMEIHERDDFGGSDEFRDLSKETPSSTTNAATNITKRVNDTVPILTRMANNVMDIESVHSSTSDSSNSATEQKHPSQLQYKPFKKTTLFERQSIREKLKHYKCDICGLRYQHRHSLTRHIKRHLVEPDTRRIHIVEPDTRRKHIVEPDTRRKQEKSVAKGMSLKRRANHIPYRNRHGYAKMGIHVDDIRIEKLGEEINVENGKLRYRCKVCLATFNSHVDLMKHITLRADYHCKEFTMKLSNLIYISLSASNLQRYIPCDLCGLFYSSRNAFHLHTSRHRRKLAAGKERYRKDVNNTERDKQIRGRDEAVSKSSEYDDMVETYNIDHNYAGTIGPQIEIVRDDIEMDIPPDSLENADNVQRFDNIDDNVLASIKQDDSSEVTSFEQRQVNVPDIGMLDSDVTQNIVIQVHDNDSKTQEIKSDYTIVGSENTENNPVIEKVESIANGQCIDYVSTTNSAQNSTLEDLKDQNKDKAVNNVIGTEESCNDYNSSDEDIVFGEDTVSRDRDIQQDLPVGTNKECMQCQIPFIERQVTVTCHLCCKRFCRPCSQVPRRVYREAFRGASFGLVWMCKVCKPAFPTFMTLLHQLGQFEDVVNTRLTNISKRLVTAEQNSVEVGSSELK